MLANQVAPRRWRLRAAGGSEIYGARPLPAEQRSLLAELTGAIRRLAATPQPWPPETISSVERRVAEVADGPGSDVSDRATIVASALRAAADDLSHVIGQAHTDTEKRTGRRL